jgi:hypothetical protein
MNLDDRVKRLSWKDVALVKMAAVLFGISVGSYFTSYFAGYELWLFFIAILLALKPTMKGWK